MQAYLIDIQKHAFQEIEGANTPEKIEKIRVKYLGRKNGLLKKVFDDLKDLAPEEKRLVGPLANQIKTDIETKLGVKIASKKSVVIRKEIVDITLPSNAPKLGHLNPLTQVIEETKEIFGSLGFTFWDGPEIETDVYNFQKLRLHQDHPSRDAQDTYYVEKIKGQKAKGKREDEEQLLLRTHTSSMQVRFLENHQPPVRVLFPGRVFRRDPIDATHLPTFTQIEGLAVGESVKLTDLLGTIRFYITKMFGNSVKVRFYGHNFPYTEPSLEVEMFYRGKWLEILGCGLVHPEVIANAGLDSKKFTGFAFGMGAERLAMLKYEIDDIRHFYNGDLRFLNQF